MSDIIADFSVLIQTLPLFLPKSRGQPEPELMNKLLLIISALLLAGCATLSENECRSADWYAIGFEDGARGRPVSYLAEHRKACADYQVTPAFEPYRQGHEQGVSQFCTADNGFALGRRGGRYQNVCPPALAAVFVPAYQRGQQIYRVERQIQDAQRQQRQEEQAIANDRTRITEIESLLIHESGNSESRKQLLAEMRALEAGIFEHQQRIFHLAEELNALYAEMRALESAP